MTRDDGTGGEPDIPLRISSSPRAPRAPERPAPNALLRSIDDEETDEKRPARLGLRLTITAVVVLALFTVMVGRLWSLQVLQTQTFKNAEITTSTRSVPLTPLRGLIFARNGQLLVGNQVLPVVTLDRAAVVNDPGVVGRLAAVLGMTVAQVEHQITDDQYSVYEPIPIEVGVPMTDILYLSEHASLFPGVSVSYQSQRSFPRGTVAPELLGFVGDITAGEYAKLRHSGYQLSDVVGQFGVEEEFESFLRGRSGTQLLTVDPQGDVLGVKHTTPSVPGDAVVLSIDLGLQQELDQALAGQIAALRRGTATTPGVPADWGAAVVMDPQNGQVLALSSDPGYQTYAISGLTPPGSTFKLATATAALDDGLLSEYSTIDDSTGSFSLCNGPGCTFLNSPGDGALGNIDVSTALKASDDVFFYTLGDDFFSQANHYGTNPIGTTAADYGLGTPTGIDTPGEAAGQVDGATLLDANGQPVYNASNPFTAGDAVEVAFGQGETEVTALQLATAYSTFANGGTRYAPQVAAAIVNAQGRVVRAFAPEVVGHVPLPASTQQAILEGLEGVVGEPCSLCTTPSAGTAAGTFAGFPLSTFPLAGKTGTATTTNLSTTAPNGLFVGFGPVTNQAGPNTGAQYVVAVIIDKAGYGASTAAPVARQIFQYLIKHPVQPFSVPLRPAG